MDAGAIECRKAVLSDLGAIKSIADVERDTLGFITRATLEQAIRDGGIMVVVSDGCVVGFQHYYHRKRDLQTTLYHKAIRPEYRGQGLGTALVDAVVEESRLLRRRNLVLKCPVELAANGFHSRYGFVLIGQEPGKKRKLNIWEYLL